MNATRLAVWVGRLSRAHQYHRAYLGYKYRAVCKTVLLNGRANGYYFAMKGKRR